MAALQFFGVTAFPSTYAPDSVYIRHSGGDGANAEAVVTDSAGNPLRWGNTAMIQAVVTAMGITSGADGKSVQMQNNGTFIQWRLVGDSTWINLVSLASITGAAALLTAGTITTLSPGSSATASITGTPPNYVLNLGLPRGADGSPGSGGAASESLNIKSMGVTGSGSDEATAFKTAIATANGKEILLENITISMKEISITNGPNIRLRGFNAVIRMLPNSPGVYPDRFWTLNGQNKVTLDGIEFDMQGAPGNETSGTRIVYPTHVSKLEIKNCNAHDNGHAAFTPVDCTDIVFDNNTIKNTDSAIFCQGYTETAIITRNKISGGTSEGIGIFNSDMSNANIPHKWVVTDNIVDSKEGFAFNMCAAHDGELANNHATNCRGLVNMYDSGSGLPASRHSIRSHLHGNKIRDCEMGINNIGSYSKVDNNTFINIQRHAINTNNYFGADSSVDNTPSTNVAITNNHFVNLVTLTEAQSGPAIHLYNLIDSTFENNVCYVNNNAYQGLKIENCGDGLLIQNNNMPALKIYPAGSGLDYTKKIDFVNNVFRNSDLAPTNPWTSGTEFGWKFREVKFTESNLTGGFENLSVASNVLKDINNGMPKVRNYVANGAVINNIARSWNNRIIMLQAGGSNSFTINNGGNISLRNSTYTISSGDLIILQYDFVFNKWRECCVSQLSAA